jgi:Tol biopolymer transport system component
MALAALLALVPTPALCQAPPVGSFQPPTLVGTLRPRNIYETLEGSISPDGRSYVFVKTERGQRRLWLLDVPSGRSRLLTPRAGDRRNVAWSSDGRRLAFIGAVKLPGYADDLDGVWVLDFPDGAEQLVHASSRYDMIWDVSWTPDGHVVFVNWAGGRGGTAPAQSVDLRTGTVAEITSDTIRIESPVASPDGRFLAFFGAYCADSTRRGIRVLTLGGSRPAASRCLADVADDTDAPVWSADGRALYVLERPHPDSLPRVVAVDVASGDRHVVDTRGVNGDVRRISITRDGRLTLAVRSGSLRVGVVPSTGGVPAVVQGDTILNTIFPVWSHDGAVVAALAPPHLPGTNERERVATIAVRSADQARGTLVLDDPRTDSVGALAWAPDGRCAVNEHDYASRDSLVELHAVSPARHMFMQAPRSLAVAGLKDKDFQFTAATQWNPAGTRVLKHAWHALYLIDRVDEPGTTRCRAGGPPRRVALDGFRGVPRGWRFSPDGRRIAFGRVASDGSEAGLFLVPSDGGRVRTVRALPLDDSFGGPEWSHDGSALYFADGDSAGVYHILRLTLSSGMVDTVTRGTVSAVHPRLSPDGTMLAVTIVDAPTTLWQMSPTGLVTVPAPTAGTRAGIAGGGPRSSTSHAPNALLVDLASRISAGRAMLEHVWPGFWADTQAYMLDAPTIPGALLVARDAPIIGFRPTSLGHAPSASLRAYWRDGRPANAESMPLPRVTIATIPRADAAESERARWRERVLFDLFHGDTVLMGAFASERAWDAGLLSGKEPKPRFELCITGLASSCGATRQLERRVLAAALAAPSRTLPAAVRRYVAVRWIRRATRGDGSGESERFYGTRAYAARRSAIALAGGDTARYAADVVAAFDALPAVDTGSYEIQEQRAAVTGQALAVLLDRLGSDWKRDLYRGDDFLALLARAVHFDSTNALGLAKPVYATFGLPALLRRALTPAETTAAKRREISLTNYNQHYYYNLLGMALGPDSAALTIYLPHTAAGSIDTMRYRIRYTPGTPDSATAPDGMVFLPSPQRFVLEGPEFRVEVRGVPVFVDTRPGTWRRTNVVFFLPDTTLNRLRVQNGWDFNRATRTIGVPPPGSQGQRIQGAGYDLRLGPSMIVEHPDVNSASIVVTEPYPKRP